MVRRNDVFESAEDKYLGGSPLVTITWDQTNDDLMQAWVKERIIAGMTFVSAEPRCP